MTEAGSDVGWRRRDRTSDIGAAALITLGGLVAKQAGAATGWRLLAWLLVAAGAALALLYRERWLERTDDGEVWLGSAWWWLRPWGARRARLCPARVVIEPEGPGWWARRRTILSIANDGVAYPSVGGGPKPFAVLERWTEPSCREYAQSVAASLARWLGVPTGGALAPFEALAPEHARARLRASLAALKPTIRSRPRRARARVSGRTHVIESGRRWFELFWRVWVTALGAALASLWRLEPSDRLFATAYGLALPVGAVLVLEGLRGLLPGRVVTQLGPQALTVERAGLSRELRVQVLFSDLAAMTLRADSGWWQLSERARPVLSLVLWEQVVVVQAADLGLRPRDLPWFVGVCREAVEAWLDRTPDGVAAEGASSTAPAPEKPPSAIATHRPDRYRPSSILSVSGSRFPRCASLAGALLLLGIHPLRISLERDLLAVPSNVFIGPWDVIGYEVDAAARSAAMLTGGLVVTTLTLMGFKLMWSAPRFTGLLVLAGLSAVISPIQVVGMASAAPDAIRIIDLCQGSATPPRFPVKVSRDHEVFHYGSFTAHRPRTAKGGGMAEHRFDRVTADADWLVEVQGLFAARYLVVADEYARICGAWKARLDALGGDRRR